MIVENSAVGQFRQIFQNETCRVAVDRTRRAESSARALQAMLVAKAEEEDQREDLADVVLDDGMRSEDYRSRLVVLQREDGQLRKDIALLTEQQQVDNESILSLQDSLERLHRLANEYKSDREDMSNQLVEFMACIRSKYPRVTDSVTLMQALSRSGGDEASVGSNAQIAGLRSALEQQEGDLIAAQSELKRLRELETRTGEDASLIAEMELKLTEWSRWAEAMDSEMRVRDARIKELERAPSQIDETDFSENLNEQVAELSLALHDKEEELHESRKLCAEQQAMIIQLEQIQTSHVTELERKLAEWVQWSESIEAERQQLKATADAASIKVADLTETAETLSADLQAKEAQLIKVRTLCEEHQVRADESQNDLNSLNLRLKSLEGELHIARTLCEEQRVSLDKSNIAAFDTEKFNQLEIQAAEDASAIAQMDQKLRDWVSWAESMDSECREREALIEQLKKDSQRVELERADERLRRTEGDSSTVLNKTISDLRDNLAALRLALSDKEEELHIAHTLCEEQQTNLRLLEATADDSDKLKQLELKADEDARSITQKEEKLTDWLTWAERVESERRDREALIEQLKEEAQRVQSGKNGEDDAIALHKTISELRESSDALRLALKDKEEELQKARNLWEETQTKFEHLEAAADDSQKLNQLEAQAADDARSIAQMKQKLSEWTSWAESMDSERRDREILIEQLQKDAQRVEVEMNNEDRSAALDQRISELSDNLESLKLALKDKEEELQNSRTLCEEQRTNFFTQLEVDSHDSEKLKQLEAKVVEDARSIIQMEQKLSDWALWAESMDSERRERDELIEQLKSQAHRVEFERKDEDDSAALNTKIAELSDKLEALSVTLKINEEELQNTRSRCVEQQANLELLEASVDDSDKLKLLEAKVVEDSSSITQLEQKLSDWASWAESMNSERRERDALIEQLKEDLKRVESERKDENDSTALKDKISELSDRLESLSVTLKDKEEQLQKTRSLCEEQQMQFEQVETTAVDSDKLKQMEAKAVEDARSITQLEEKLTDWLTWAERVESERCDREALIEQLKADAISVESKVKNENDSTASNAKIVLELTAKVEALSSALKEREEELQGARILSETNFKQSEQSERVEQLQAQVLDDANLIAEMEQKLTAWGSWADTMDSEIRTRDDLIDQLKKGSAGSA